jgi:hypothetical protein
LGRAQRSELGGFRVSLRPATLRRLQAALGLLQLSQSRVRPAPPKIIAGRGPPAQPLPQPGLRISILTSPQICFQQRVREDFPLGVAAPMRTIWSTIGSIQQMASS